MRTRALIVPAISIAVLCSIGCPSAVETPVDDGGRDADVDPIDGGDEDAGGDGDVDGDGDSDGDGDGDGDGDVTWEPSHPESFGAPGWRESTVPLCRPDETGYTDSLVWADDRGVFVYLPSQPDPFEGGTVYFNDGTGWRSIIDLGGIDAGGLPLAPVNFVTGIPGGDVLIAADTGLVMVDPATGEYDIENISFKHIFAHSASLAYGISWREPLIFVFDGTSWSPLPGDPMPFEAYRVWGDADAIFAVGDSGMILSAEGGEWTVHDTGTTDSFTSVWGFSSDDVYAGTVTGELFHFDGSSWTSTTWRDDADVDLPCIDYRLDLWGAIDGALFVHDSVRFARLLDGGSDVLGRWLGRHGYDEAGHLDCADHFFVHSIWGTSPTDVFLVVSESQEETQPCEEFLLYWDGAEFHWF